MGSFKMFTNALVQAYFSIHYAVIIGGNKLTYDVTDGINYSLVYETPEMLYNCTGQAAKFSMFDPHTMADNTERTIDQLQVSGPKVSGWMEHESPGATCSQQSKQKIVPVVRQLVKKNDRNVKVLALSAKFSYVDPLSHLPEFFTADMSGFFRKLSINGQTNCTVKEIDSDLIVAALSGQSLNSKYNESLFYAPEKHLDCKKGGKIYTDKYAAASLFSNQRHSSDTNLKRINLTNHVRQIRQQKLHEKLISDMDDLLTLIKKLASKEGNPSNRLRLVEEARSATHKECEAKKAAFYEHETKFGLKHLPVSDCPMRKYFE